jgi:hypothetical protein
MLSKSVIVFSLLVMLTTTSCKISGNKSDSPAPKDGIGEIKDVETRNFTPSEVIIGRRICASLVKKRHLFEVLENMKEQFRFKAELKNCLLDQPYNLAEFVASISNASASEFEYVARNRPDYFKDVVTDQTGAARLLCEALEKSETVSNQFLTGSSYLTMKILIQDGFDKLEILKKNSDGKGNYNLVSTEAITFFTMKNQVAEKFLGVEKERVRYLKCADKPDQSSYVKQTWLSALTAF